ncbi:MAG: LysE family transporter [Bacteroidales bacterium]|nr:LysE family transporter [Candidatus Cryptobacteroides equifaecalis]
MPLSLLPSLLLSILVVGYTPGPANLYSLACSLRYGRKAAMKMWAGLFVGFSIALLLMVMLTFILGEVLGQYIKYLKYLGAAYILWLAWKTWRYSGKTDMDARDCNFVSGLIVQLTNVKMLLFELTVFSVYVMPYSNKLTDLLIVAPLLLLAGPGANFAWIAAGNILRKSYSEHYKVIDIIMAILLAACALFIVL